MRSPEAAAQGVRTEIVATLAGLEALEPEWRRLWAACRTATPFQSPQWSLPWWKHVGRGTLASIAFRSAATGALVGLAPLYVYTRPEDGCRHLFPIGIATTDYLDVLADPDWEDAVLDALAQQLQAMGDTWDVFEAPQLGPDALLRRLAPPGELGTSEPNPVLSLAAPDPWHTVPRAMRQNLHYCRRRAGREHAVSYELADAQSLPDFLDALARLHAQRWSERGEAGVLDANVLAAHREAAPLLLKSGLLRLQGLRFDGQLVAVLYALADRRRCYYYLGGFDPRFRTLSPGTLVIGQAIEQAIAEGAQAFDFLRGAEAYKYRWGAVDQAMARLRIEPQHFAQCSVDQAGRLNVAAAATRCRPA